MLVLTIDKKKMMIDGCGSMTAYCNQNGIDPRTVFNIMQSKRRRFVSGSNKQLAADRMIKLGVAKWEDIPDEEVTA